MLCPFSHACFEVIFHIIGRKSEVTFQGRVTFWHMLLSRYMREKKNVCHSLYLTLLISLILLIIKLISLTLLKYTLLYELFINLI